MTFLEAFCLRISLVQDLPKSKYHRIRNILMSALGRRFFGLLSLAVYAYNINLWHSRFGSNIFVPFHRTRACHDILHCF